MLRRKKQKLHPPYSKEDLNLIQQDDQPSSTDDEDTQEINTLTKQQDLLFEAIFCSKKSIL